METKGQSVKLWIKISSENRKQGAWFFDLDYAKQCAKSWEKLIPIELTGWMDVADDNPHTGDGEYAGTTFPDLIEVAYQKGLSDGAKEAKG